MPTNNRQKNQNWNVGPNSDGRFTWDDIKVAVLMDIRDELQELNRTFNCPNFRDMPNQLRNLRIAMERKHRKKSPSR